MMTKNHKRYHFFALIATLLLIVMSYNQCSQKSPLTSNEPAPERTPSSSQQRSNLSDVASKTGVRNFNQAIAFAAGAMGIPRDSNDFDALGDHVNGNNRTGGIKARMPQKNDLASFNSTNALAMVNLASEACNRGIEVDNNIRNAFFADTINTRTPLEDTDVLYFTIAVDHMIKRFFPPRFYNDMEFRNSTINAIVNDIDEIYIQGDEGTDIEATRRALRYGCTVALSSAMPYVL